MEEKKRSAVTRFYDMLREQIVTLRLAPGQLLLVQQLAAQYELSRTPVREALVRLKEEGLVEEADGRKFRVADVSWKLIEENYQARQIIEEAAASYAAQYASPDKLAQIRELLAHMEEACVTQDYEAYFDMDQKFHRAILDVMDNHILNGWMDENAARQQRIRYCTMGIRTNLTASFAEHQEIFEHIRGREAEAARLAIRGHLERAAGRLLELKEQAATFVFIR